MPDFFIVTNIDFENKIFLSDGTCMLAAADCHPLPECPPGTPVRCGGKHPLILYKFTHVPDFFIIANIDFEKWNIFFQMDHVCLLQLTVKKYQPRGISDFWSFKSHMYNCTFLMSRHWLGIIMILCINLGPDYLQLIITPSQLNLIFLNILSFVLTIFELSKFFPYNFQTFWVFLLTILWL